MTSGRIWDWQCLMFLYTSVAYYEWDISIWEDGVFDHHCKLLCDRYDRLPVWFTSRVSRADLVAGTGFSVSVTNDERRETYEWIERGTREGWLTL